MTIHRILKQYGITKKDKYNTDSIAIILRRKISRNKCYQKYYCCQIILCMRTILRLHGIIQKNWYGVMIADNDGKCQWHGQW